jgi:hypothetical protein
MAIVLWPGLFEKITKRHAGDSRRLSGVSGQTAALDVNIDRRRDVAISRSDKALQDAG